MLSKLWEGTVRLLEETIPSLVVLGMFVVVVYQIFMRDLANRPPIWSDELARYLYIWMVFLGTASVSRRQAHVGLDFVPSKLNGRRHSLLLIIHEGMIVAFLFYGFKSAIGFLTFYHAIPSPAMGLPSGYLVIVMPVACVLMLVHHLQRLVVLVRLHTTDGGAK